MNLVTLINGVAVASSAAIADGTDNQHKNVMELIRTYQADLEEFGGVAFETRPFETAGGQQQREVALLNEEQATLLITYLRNNEVVRGFKKRLVRGFFDLRAAAADPMRALGDPATLRNMLLGYTETVLKLEAQVAAAAPAVAFVDKFVQADGLKGFRETCKLLKANEARFTEFVLAKKIMYRLAGKLTAHQQHIDAGRFEVRAGVATATEHAYTTTKFSPKGVTWIAGEWAKHQLAAEAVEA